MFIVSDRSKDGDLCYKQMSWIDVWMNEASNKKALGVPSDLKFASCNMEVNQAFFMQGDSMHNSAALLPDIINDDIKLLVYAGNADAMCNFMVSTRFSPFLTTVLLFFLHILKFGANFSLFFYLCTCLMKLNRETKHG